MSQVFILNVASRSLENVSRSLVIKLEIYLMGIHLSCKFGDCVSKLKEVRDVRFT